MKRKYISAIICAAVILGVMVYAIFNFGRNDVEFVEAINNKAISANILLINITEEAGSTSFSAGQSGVIFKKDAEKYYVLTALHGLEPDQKKIKIIALGYDQPTYNEAGVNMGLKGYYEQFPQALLEYYNDTYDLAVISFYSKKEYAVLSIASGFKYKEPVAAIGNPHEGSRNSITTGKITSKNPVPFGDIAGLNQYPVIEHSAKISQGSSGGALLNKDMEVVGIVLGASENIFHQFVKGKAMPCDRILEFLSIMDMEL
ncbi:trypsin-like peptidase domain-containing protein [Aminipila butyrica]|uniref:Trypsin-like peptidase domain-containing protein n=1 Tax=Aminipila butyrica TaxID=433296 RepID=A0A858BVU8_9FIRM|nr:serine protease [Aminipila butyrica]QIB69717.1 trypsin-like peptidase domain-containing protein [Aminipila butyrica]